MSQGGVTDIIDLFRIHNQSTQHSQEVVCYLKDTFVFDCSLLMSVAQNML